MNQPLRIFRLKKYKLVKRLNQQYFSRGGRFTYNPDGMDVFAEDWDNLLVLDACRFDTYRDRVTIEGNLSERESRGAATSEWMNGNFTGRELHDTVYVTGNPVFYQIEDELDVEFHAVYDVWREEGWESDLGTVLPEDMVRYAELAANRHPNKRLLVHFLQPHLPFLGPYGRETFGVDDFNFWRRIHLGELTPDMAAVRRAYNENLDEALPHVKTLLDSLTGKTVISSDHGQVFGERVRPIPIREYGHPDGIHVESLVAVPWHEVKENGTRREITADPPVERQRDTDSQTVEQRLASLGYVDEFD